MVRTTKHTKDTKKQEFWTPLAERHHGKTRSQAPAWERTAMEALPPALLFCVVVRQAGACKTLGSQAGAWEPAVVMYILVNPLTWH